MQAQLDGHENNIHCLALAVNQTFGVLFTLCGHDDIEDRLKEFLALASSALLRLAEEGVPKEDARSVFICAFLFHYSTAESVSEIVRVCTFFLTWWCRRVPG